MSKRLPFVLLAHGRYFGASCNHCSHQSNNQGPLKVKNPRPRGIVPIGEDYGGYDENKHEEFEEQAEQRQQRIKRLKKIVSSAVFLSIFVTVMWARNRKQRMVAEYMKDVKFLAKDDLFTGSFTTFCVVKSGDGLESTVLSSEVVRDGTLKFIQGMELRSSDVVVASFPKTGNYLALMDRIQFSTDVITFMTSCFIRYNVGSRDIVFNCQ